VTLGLFDAAFVGGLVGSAYDVSAQAYITAVETADGQALETAVRDAINAFVVGCKADGIWNAIKASCIMAGARTLNGALTPLVGTAPTNFNFVAGDYNRKTGLKGNGSTKRLDSNRTSLADPQNNCHLSVYQSEVFTTGIVLIGDTLNPRTAIYTSGYALKEPNVNTARTPNVTGFIGASRASSGGYTVRQSSTSIATGGGSSQTPSAANINVFARDSVGGTGPGHVDSRFAFYSIGESLNLALLDARVTTLMNALAVAIP
jgi:hypothetical protein